MAYGNDATAGNFFTATPPNTGVPVSMSAWFMPNATQNSTIVTYRNSGETNNHRMGMTLAGAAVSLSAVSRDTAGSSAATTNDYNTSEWNHGVVVFASPTSRTALLNSDQSGSVTETTSRTPTGIDTLNIGTRLSGTQEIDGELDEVGVWDIALSIFWQLRLGPASRWSPLLVMPHRLIAYYSFRVPDFNKLPPQLGRVHRLSNKYRLSQNGSMIFSSPPPGIVYPRERLVVPTEQAGVAAAGMDYLAATIRKRSIHPLVQM